MKKSNTSPTIKLTITDIAPDGNGLATHRKRTIAVPYTIPGEVLTAKITGKDQAQGIQLHEASADRVKPRCSHFGPGHCAGCQWQHMNYEAQIALKTDLVLGPLEGIARLTDPPLQMALASPEQWQYSHQARFRRTKDGKWGFRGTDHRQTITVQECHIIQPEILEILASLDFTSDTITELWITVGTEGDPMIVLRTKDDTPPELTSTLPVSINFVLKDREPLNLVGQTHVLQRIHDRVFRVTAGVDFRPNRPQIEHLVDRVIQYLQPQPDDLVLDLYSGTGIFAAFIAPEVDIVTCVDSFPPAATDAEHNLEDQSNIDIIEGSVQDILEVLIEDDDAQPYTAAILDPPHTGLTEGVMEALGQLLIPRLVYISQKPESLARDMRDLINRYGYTPVEIQPIDFEPQTANIQCVALLERKNNQVWK